MARFFTKFLFEELFRFAYLDRSFIKANHVIFLNLFLSGFYDIYVAVFHEFLVLKGGTKQMK